MSKRTIVKDASYTAKDIDMVSIIIFNSGTDCALTLPSPAGLIYADCDVHNKGIGTVTIGTQTVATGSHAHISNDGTVWVVVIGGGAETDPVFTASAAAGIDAADITQWDAAQKNSDITKAEIEAKLIGTITSHEHPNSDTSSDLIRFDKEAYYMQNVKTVDTYQDWYTSGNVEKDSVNVLIGSSSVKILVNDDGQAPRAISKAAPEGQPFDFTRFSDGSQSTGDDSIRLVCYISDVTKVTYVVVFFMSANGYYYTLWSTGLVTGWNYLEMKKSSTAVSGTPDWSAVMNIQSQWFNNANANGSFVSFQLLEMVRQDPIENYPNPFQTLKNNVRVAEFIPYTGKYFLGILNSKLVCKPISDGTLFGLLSKEPIYNSNNTTYIKRKCVSASYDNGLGYYLDANNFIRIYVVSNLLMVVHRVDGVQTVNQISGSLNLSVDDEITYKLAKRGSSIFVQALINEDPKNSANYTFETSLSESIRVMFDSSTMSGAYGGYIEDAAFSSGDFLLPSSTLRLGETSTTAYPGDKGKVAYDHSQSAHLGLGETETTAYRGDLGKIAYDHSQSEHTTGHTIVSANGNLYPIEQRPYLTFDGQGINTYNHEYYPFTVVDIPILEPLTDGDPYNPEIIYDMNGDVVMGSDYKSLI